MISSYYCFGTEHQEADLTLMKKAKMREETLEREASLRRARQEASLADGISWGMGEDAVEETEVCAMNQQKIHLGSLSDFLRLLEFQFNHVTLLGLNILAI